MPAKDSHTVFNNLVTRFISGELTPGEEARFMKVVSGDPELEGRLREYQRVWDSMGEVAGKPGYDLDVEWALLSDRIPGLEETGREPGRKKDMVKEIQEEAIPATGRGRVLLFYTYRVVAALVVGILFAFAWIYASRFSGTTLVAASEKPVEVFLEDGSRVLLNRDSRIRYPKRFNHDERRVRLGGEAWFDVSKDTVRGFVIDAGSAMVEVLGTSFNVNAYRENPVVEITVESGVVSLSAKNDQQEQIVLHAGNSGTCHGKSRELVLVPVSDPNNISWKTRNLYFENTALEEVARVLQKVYNVEITFLNPDLASCPITVTFADQSLESVLNVLVLTLDLEVSRTGNRISVDGPGCAD